MGGRQSGRLITSNGKSFPCLTITTGGVHFIPSRCFSLYLYKYSCACLHVSNAQWLTLTPASYLSYHVTPSDSISKRHWCKTFCSFGRILRPALTCNSDIKLHDSWKRYKTSLWKNICTQHVPKVCHGKMLSACLILEAVKQCKKAEYLPWIIKWSSNKSEMEPA